MASVNRSLASWTTSGDMLSIEDDAGYADMTALPVEKQTGLTEATFDSAPPGGVEHCVRGYFRAISGYTTGANPTGLITASNGVSLTIDPILFFGKTPTTLDRLAMAKVTSCISCRSFVRRYLLQLPFA